MREPAGRIAVLSRTLGGALAALLAAHGARAAPPATAIGAMQPRAESTPVTLAIGGPSGQRLAQTFTVELGGQLIALFLPVECASGGLRIEIRDVAGDEPGGAVLLSREVPASLVASLDFHFQLFDLGGSVEVAPGTRLAFVLGNPKGSCGIARGPAGDPYAGGAGFFEAGPNPPGWVRLAASGRDDLPFMAVVKTAPAP
jgi:hypothetical protein